MEAFDFFELCAAHDWHYIMSEDNTARAKGEKERSHLLGLLTVYPHLYPIFQSWANYVSYGVTKPVKPEKEPAAASSAPLKVTIGALLTAPEVGAEEYVNGDWYYTGTDGGKERQGRTSHGYVNGNRYYTGTDGVRHKKILIEPKAMLYAKWNREWPDPNYALVQWPYGYAEIHGSRHGRELVAEFLEHAHALYVDAMRWRWMRKQEGWPESEAQMSGATPQVFDKLADDGIDIDNELSGGG